MTDDTAPQGEVADEPLEDAEPEFLRDVEYTTVFRRDFKREKKGQHRRDVEALFEEKLALLADDLDLPDRCRDHVMTGKYKDCRDCHIKPDLVLIYRKPDPKVPDPNTRLLLQLIRLGSHAELDI